MPAAHFGGEIATATQKAQEAKDGLEGLIAALQTNERQTRKLTWAMAIMTAVQVALAIWAALRGH